MNATRVTICIPTFGRPELLEEAIECFLRQTWPNKRLIIGNDFADQTLVCDHPWVSVVNRAERFPTLGAKRNWMMSMAGECHIGHWDDDDLYLPNHISDVMSLLPQFKADAAKQHHQWYDNNHAKFRIGFASYMHTIIAHRSVYRKAGDYGEINMNEDADLLNRMLKKKLMMGPPQKLHEPTFIQRLGTHRHMTDFGDNCFEKMAETAKSSGRSGVIELRPQWRKDYAAMAAASWAAVQEVACRQ
jgi:glycosyltransferase involved in cell wall biosynthesis